MTDVFISYARPNEDQARSIAAALRSCGFDVWYDEDLPAHRPYAEVIEERLKSSRAVVVIWSAEAAKSQWVRAEADWARAGGKLVQISFDDTMPPLPFNQIQCADLGDWNGDPRFPGFRKLSDSVSALVPAAIPAPPAAQSPAGLSICVLPFANMSGDPEQDYFSDGISEDIITDLTKISGLSVTARNTAFTFKGAAVDVPLVARQLNVLYVLEGSVRKAGSRVRITAQLIDGASGNHLWAERYDRDLTDIFAIQDELSAAIVGTLKLKLLRSEKNAIERRGTENAEAYDLYLMARQYWINGNYGDRRRDEAITRICRNAIEIDPNYARAWALMALAQTELRFRHETSPDDGRDAAERALALDPNLAEAHCVISICASQQGDWDQAEKEMSVALELDPESWEVNKEAGRFALKRGRTADAIPFFVKATSLMEADYHSPGMLVFCRIALGDREGAIAAARINVERTEQAIAQDQNNGVALGHGAYSLAYLGEIDRARDWTRRALLVDPDNQTLRYNIACSMIVNFKDFDAALALLGPYFAQASASLVNYTDKDPDLDSIRHDARFQAIVTDAKKRLGLEPTASP